jgi:hypothetical protein
MARAELKAAAAAESAVQAFAPSLMAAKEPKLCDDEHDEVSFVSSDGEAQASHTDALLDALRMQARRVIAGDLASVATPDRDSMRAREDVAAYLRDLDDASLVYDPKSRTARRIDGADGQAALDADFTVASTDAPAVLSQETASERKARLLEKFMQ